MRAGPLGGRPVDLLAYALVAVVPALTALVISSVLVLRVLVLIFRRPT
jgi:hypothetical protein